MFRLESSSFEPGQPAGQPTRGTIGPLAAQGAHSDQTTGHRIAASEGGRAGGFDNCKENHAGLTLVASLRKVPSRPVAIPQSSAAARTPRLVPGVDQRTLPIGPQEAFILSRVDGKTSQSDISAATGLPPELVGETLDRLIELGAVEIQDSSRPAGARPAPVPQTGIASKLDRPVVETVVGDRFDQVESAALYDPGELDEDCDLELARKRTILDLYYRLEQLDHYALLDLPTNAEKKEVKAAYFKYVGIFHPDKYFGKNLGSFRPKLEKVFARLTEAHDTLTRKKTRHEYDEYLAKRRRNRALERALYGERDHHDELERAHQRIHEAARPRSVTRDPRVDDEEPPQAHVEPTTERTTDTDTGATPAAEEAAAHQPASPPSNPPPRAEVPREKPIPVNVPAPDPEARRRAFARRMRRGSPSVPPPSPTTPGPPPATSKRQVADDLKRMYSTRVRGARDQQVQSYVNAAEVALAEENPVAAANALRVAVSLAPDDADVQQRLAQVERDANAKLAGSYLEQAQYEEKEQHWAEASISYRRAALGNPTARTHERVAFCLLKANGDLKQASEHAKEAVKLAPNQASMRVTLAEVYLKAGMRQSAAAEFERAQALAPHDDTIKDWLKRIRRNQV